MLPYPLVLLATGLMAILALPALAQNLSTMPDGLPAWIFSAAPLGDDQLAASTGGLADRDRRLLVDAESLGFLQQVERSTSVAMDNWWGQTGAALIDNNLLRVR